MQYLVATDGSAHSTKTLEMVGRLAKSQDSIILYNCYTAPSRRKAAAAYEDPEQLDVAAKERSNKVLQDVSAIYSNTVKGAGKVETVSEELLDCREGILQLARQRSVQNIVVGARGLGTVQNLGRLVMGSVSTYVLHNADNCNVVVVK
eukprot:TRINITY_DN5421_c0_g1_i1.p1 TRINITY_DN5421_c0_g1~~TRINITY_DN5421_c0_g1_i1.p1  ORF type:complete len:148 (+),score=34.76 TRINITY_DN5421_c0_g1_i1:55-498(+)